jgi:hypothetical protein
VRAARRLTPNARQANGRYALTDADFARLRAHLGVSPPDRELVRARAATVTAGHRRTATIWHANRLHPLWTQLSPGLARVVPPTNLEPPDARIPPRLTHLFWNTADSQLHTAHGGPYIARRLLRTLDFDGLAWGAANLTPADWRTAARARGLDASVKALAENLAVAAEAP